jgi:predicted enzyme related to lactoylglutathione lyase
MSSGFFWYDIMTTDPKAAAKFYADVVGWGITPAVGGHDYTVFTVDGQGVAGLMSIPDEAAASGAKPGWLGYISADDVDASVAKLKQAGGTVHREPFTVPDIIRFAVVADPQGAMFYIGKGLSKETPREFPMGTPGTIGWRELYAGDGPSAYAFYEKMFGWTKAEAMDMGPMGVYQIFATGDVPNGAVMTKPDAVPHPVWGFYFNVPAIDAASDRVRAGGGNVVNGPMEVPGGQWIVQCVDPQGAFFALVAPKR